MQKLLLLSLPFASAKSLLELTQQVKDRNSANSLGVGNMAEMSILNNLQSSFGAGLLSGGSNEDPSLDRVLTEEDMGLLNNYGCWCYFEDNHGKGRGTPSDDIDQMCKVLHEGYECIIQDMLEAGTPCVPWEIDYNSSGENTIADLRNDCDTQNPGNANACAAATCKVEGWFVAQYVKYMLSGGLIDQSKQHENGFNTDVECHTGSGVKSEKACCGEHPTRRSFKTYGGDRACCNGHTYNAQMFECCNTGNIALSCP